jgi:DNA-binding MarR family transcriptional regulator
MATIPLDLVKRDRSPSAFVIYIYLSSKAGAKGLRASLHTIAEDTGFSKSAVQNALRLLNRRKLIRTEKSSPTATPVHHIVR